MNVRILTLILLLLMPGGAMAGLSRTTLQTVSANPPPGAKLDLSLTAPDTSGTRHSIGVLLQGHPGFVNFVDYTCRTLCGTDLMLLSDAIRRAGLKPADFRIIAIGLDPKDSAQAAIKMERDQIPAALHPITTFLLPDQATIGKATGALGFRYAYDAQRDQFAHPAVVYAIAPDGSLRAALSPLALNAGDLRQVLTTAQPPSLYQRIRALCYGYDPETGIYTSRIMLLLQAGALATLLLLALVFLRRYRRQPP